jgi:small basic protein
LKENELVDNILKIFKPWATDSAGNETYAQIKTESRFFSFLVIVNLILTLIAAILFIVPVPNDEEVYFAMYLFDRWFPSCAPILKWFYRSTILVVAFAIVTSAHMFLYVAEQLKFQIYLLCKNIGNITSLVEYCDDGFLVNNKHYQIAVESRIKFCIKRHIELIK